MPHTYCGASVPQTITARLVTYPDGAPLPEAELDGVTYTLADPGTEFQIRVSLETAQHPDVLFEVHVDGKYVGIYLLGSGVKSRLVQGFSAVNDHGDTTGHRPFKLAKTVSVPKPAPVGDANAVVHPTGATGQVSFAVYLGLPRVPYQPGPRARNVPPTAPPATSKAVDAPDTRKFFLNPSVSTLASASVIPSQSTTFSHTVPRGAKITSLSTRIESRDTVTLRKNFIERRRHRAALKNKTGSQQGEAKSGSYNAAGREARGVKRASASSSEGGAGAGCGAGSGAGAAASGAKYVQDGTRKTYVAGGAAPVDVKPDPGALGGDVRKRRRKRSKAPPVVVDLTVDDVSEPGTGGDVDGELIDLT